tara:strand:- start:10441 stop:10824 length:384 start_codon:yes stop_codon:yes gene_type:complete
MFAILDHNGKQFKVQEGDTIRLDNVGKMKEIVFEDILIFNNKDGETIIGSPFVSSVRIIGKVLENLKDKKIVVFKKKRRHNYRRKIGHRQQISVIKITDIQFLSKSNKDLSKKSNESKDLKTKSKTE